MATNSGENGNFGKSNQMHTFFNLLHTLKMKFAETTQRTAKQQPITYVYTQQQPKTNRKTALNEQGTRNEGKKMNLGGKLQKIAFSTLTRTLHILCVIFELGLIF